MAHIHGINENKSANTCVLAGHLKSDRTATAITEDDESISVDPEFDCRFLRSKKCNGSLQVFKGISHRIGAAHSPEAAVVEAQGIEPGPPQSHHDIDVGLGIREDARCNARRLL